MTDDRPDRGRDEAEIRKLAYSYAQAFDDNLGDVLADIFTPDGVIEAPNGRFAGTEALRGAPAVVAGRYLKTFHAVLNQTAEIDGDRAAAKTYCIARHLLPGEDGGFVCLEMTLRYEDALVRTAGGWLFERRRLLLDWMHSYPVEPPVSRQGV